MAPKGIAILGSGIFAREAHLPALASAPLAEAALLKAIYSRTSNSASAFAREARAILRLDTLDVYHDEDPSTSLDVLLARTDIAAVIVVLPITVQPDIIRKAMAAGKHVLSEKPVGPDVSSARALIREYEAEYKPDHLVWRVAENYEAEAAFRTAGRFVREGRLGDIKFFSARAVNWVDENSKWYKTPWRTVPEYQGGFLLDGGVHTIAALRTILPPAATFTTLSAHASLANPILPPHDTIHAVVQTATGAHGIVELTWGAPVPSRARLAHAALTVTGTAGWLEVSRAPTRPGYLRVAVRTAVLDERGRPTGEEREEVVDEREVGVEEEIRSFLAALGGDDDGLDQPRSALVDVAFIEAALNSEGKPVDLAALATV